MAAATAASLSAREARPTVPTAAPEYGAPHRQGAGGLDRAAGDDGVEVGDSIRGTRWGWDSWRMGGGQGGFEAVAELVGIGGCMGEGQVKFGAHRIEEHLSAEEFEHDGAAAGAVAGQPGFLVDDRLGGERDLGERAIAEDLAGGVGGGEGLGDPLTELAAEGVEAGVGVGLEKISNAARAAAEETGLPPVVDADQA